MKLNANSNRESSLPKLEVQNEEHNFPLSPLTPHLHNNHPQSEYSLPTSVTDLPR